MSVRVMKNGGPEGSSGFVHGITNMPLIDSPEMYGGDRWFSVEEKVVEKERNVRKKRPVMMMMKTSSSSSSSSSASSIGKNSDVTGELEENSGESDEVQSPFKGPLEAMDALEEVLPFRRGISRFYNGKSKSFASLADASSLSTIKHIAKPENTYMKKRRNILASTLAWDKNHRPAPSLHCNGGGIAKRITYNSSSSRANAMAFALTTNSSDIIASSPILGGSRFSPHFEDVLSSSSSLLLSSSTRCKNLSAWRSFSLADLQQSGCILESCTSPNQADSK